MSTSQKIKLQKAFPERLLQYKKKKPIIPFIQVVIACGEESFILWHFSGVIES